MSCPYQHGSAPQAICDAVEKLTGINPRSEWHAQDDGIDEMLDMWDGTDSSTMTEEELKARRKSPADRDEALDAAAEFFESEGIDPNGVYAEVLLNGDIASGKLKMTRGNAANLSSFRRTLNRRRERLADGSVQQSIPREYSVHMRYSTNPATRANNDVVIGDITAFSEEQAIEFAMNEVADPDNVVIANATDVTPAEPCSPEGLADSQWYSRGSRGDAEEDFGAGYAVLRSTSPDGTTTMLATRMVDVDANGGSRWEYTVTRTDINGNEEEYTMADLNVPPSLRGNGPNDTVGALHSMFSAHSETDGNPNSDNARMFPWSPDLSDDLATMANYARMGRNYR